MILDVVILSMILVLAFAIVRTENLVHAVVYGSVFSLLSALLYLFMHAPDVALTEAAIGACITTCLFLAVLRVVKNDTGKVKHHKFLVIICLLFFCLMSFVSLGLHSYGDVNAITNGGVVEYYKKHFVEDAGLLSMVNVILSSYRGFDTFGETLVIFIAGICVWLILGSNMFIRRSKHAK